jgi:hypothetical protein
VAAADPANLVVCDAGPLIHLDELGCLSLLRDFVQVQVPDAVWQEVRRHRPSALRRRSVKLHRSIALSEAAAELIELAQAFLLDLKQANPERIAG